MSCLCASHQFCLLETFSHPLLPLNPTEPWVLDNLLRVSQLLCGTNPHMECRIQLRFPPCHVPVSYEWPHCPQPKTGRESVFRKHALWPSLSASQLASLPRNWGPSATDDTLPLTLVDPTESWGAPLILQSYRDRDHLLSK